MPLLATGSPATDPNSLVSYLDLPELLSLSRTSWNLRTLATDPILHRKRILVVAPSRVGHSLFAQGVAGPIRPTVPDLVQRNVLRGLQIERRWRMGAYLYSAQVGILVFPGTLQHPLNYYSR